MASVYPFFLRLKEFLDAVPGEKGRPVDWEELAERKEVARMALEALAGMADGRDPGLKPGKPRGR